MNDTLNKIRSIAKCLANESYYNKYVSGLILVLCDAAESEISMHEQILHEFYIAAMDRAEKAEAELKEVETDLENLRSNY